MATELADQHWIETYKSLITLSIEGFKFAALANGGAAVALLAYLGNVAGKGAATPDMRCAMAAFLAGLATCGLAMLFAYLTQLKLLNESGKSERPKVSHGWLLRCAILLFLCSLVFFGFGSWQAVVGFKQHDPTPTSGLANDRARPEMLLEGVEPAITAQQAQVVGQAPCGNEYFDRTAGFTPSRRSLR